MPDLAPRRWSGQRAGAAVPGGGARPRAACSPRGQRRRGQGLQRPAAAPGRGPPAPHAGTGGGRQGQQHHERHGKKSKVDEPNNDTEDAAAAVVKDGNPRKKNGELRVQPCAVAEAFAALRKMERWRRRI